MPGTVRPKEAIVFVQPPLHVLQSLVAVRLHLDACGAMDGPLQVIPGTHQQGLIEPAQAALARKQSSVEWCTAEAGSAMIMKPLLLHASSKATGTSQRRVLHFVFGPLNLPCGVRWHDAVGKTTQSVTAEMLAAQG